jgi:hypothetical protein
MDLLSIICLRLCAVFTVAVATLVIVSVVSASQTDVKVIADFFAATRFENMTAVTLANVCSQWSPMITCDAVGDIVALDFSSKSLIGTIPASLSNLTKLGTFVVTANSLAGVIPHELSMWGRQHKNI